MIRFDRNGFNWWALDEKLKTIAAAGFDAVEIFVNDFTCFDGWRVMSRGRTFGGASVRN